MTRNTPSRTSFSILMLFTCLSFTASAQAASSSLPHTRALEQELAATEKTLASTRARQSRLQQSAADARQQLQNVRNMIKALKSVEDKIRRIEKELTSLAKIPQLKLFKPVASGLKNLRGRVKQVREKADRFRKNFVEPNISRLRRLESQIRATVTRLRALEQQTRQAKGKARELRRFAETHARRPGVTRAAEQLASTSRQGLRPLRQTLTEIDAAGRTLETQLRTCSSTTRQMLSLQTGVTKLNSQLAPVDRKARDVARVMNRKLGFKIPLSKKRVSVTVRQILEAPDRIIGAAVKPLTKLAGKALKPLTKKVKFNLKPPKELAEISRKLDQLNRLKLDVDRTTNRLKRASGASSLRQLESTLNKLIRTNVARLG